MARSQATPTREPGKAEAKTKPKASAKIGKASFRASKSAASTKSVASTKSRSPLTVEDDSSNEDSYHASEKSSDSDPPRKGRKVKASRKPRDDADEGEKEWGREDWSRVPKGGPSFPNLSGKMKSLPRKAVEQSEDEDEDEDDSRATPKCRETSPMGPSPPSPPPPNLSTRTDATSPLGPHSLTMHEAEMAFTNFLRAYQDGEWDPPQAVAVCRAYITKCLIEKFSNEDFMSNYAPQGLLEDVTLVERLEAHLNRGFSMNIGLRNGALNKTASWSSESSELSEEDVVVAGPSKPVSKAGGRREQPAASTLEGRKRKTHAANDDEEEMEEEPVRKKKKLAKGKGRA